MDDLEYSFFQWLQNNGKHQEIIKQITEELKVYLEKLEYSDDKIDSTGVLNKLEKIQSKLLSILANSSL